MAMASADGSTILSENARLKTLVLKSQAEQMRDDLEYTVEARVNAFTAKYKVDANENELSDFIDASFDDVEREVLNQLSNMKAEVKSHAPKKPVKKPQESDEEFLKSFEKYEKEKLHFIKYVGFVTTFLEGLAGLFRDTFISIREFFKSLWTWIKQALKDVAKKVSDFIRFLKEKITKGIEALIS